MPDFTSFDLALWDWLILGLCAFLVGVSKTGIPGFGILVVPIMASILPAKTSVGVLLPMLIFADLFAAGYWRYHAQWKHLFRLIPWALSGIIVAYFVMDKIKNDQLKPMIGIIVLVMLAIRLRQNLLKQNDQNKSVLTHQAYAATMGLLAGFTTMMAHAAGPVMTLYLLAMRMPKTKFIGTTAWFFFIINWLKVPFSARLELITAETLKLDLCLFPLIFAGAVAGINQQQGASVGPGIPIVRIISDKDLLIRFAAPTDESRRIATGSPIVFQARDGEATLHGRVERAAPGVDAVSSYHIFEAVLETAVESEQTPIIGLSGHVTIAVSDGSWHGSRSLRQPAGR